MKKEKSNPIEELTWQDMRFHQIIMHSGGDSKVKTGDWRYQRPVVEKEKCNKCGLCWLFCPDRAIDPLENGYYKPELAYCKGCGICARECPKEAIIMIEEKE